ncbi:tetratricopeptide repeat protein [Ichthyenterobacterium sp. W332]|uniref:Tetratricopeptide repeat protein n=1 Tax=Microcosmobacter mediterraneus TaxID=3075607 RepID=A0ABU2YJZ7_9FLAO|nr:tetratricopeptide repeat protein [Ichthyenterobacterium sp. W332]MDT0558206.1 tetratricopeptide repeat protein [Ichthyenterobacterium sp. W332]
MLELKKIHIKQILITVVFFTTSIIYSQNETLFQRGNDLYNQGKYEDAIEIYQKVIDSDKHSSELYFNLGNAHYKLNNIASSIYNYEKALILSPSDKEVENNLAFARNMTIDAIDNSPEVGFSKLFKSVVNKFSFDQWAKLSVGFVIGFVLFFLLYYFAYNTTKKRIAFIASTLCLFLVLVSLALAFKKSELVKNDTSAIVFATESIVKSDPNSTSSDLFRLHEGTKIKVLESFDDWDKIKLSDGETGWISSEDIKRIEF